ncbi:HET domain-containing protein [Rutstroemia sp. NJR-2017a BVV2]|nr:HET domain-containing protein [Rutstroemia sp. NJR-2017a BVV2]
MKTTKQNLDAHLRGIPSDRIPKTIGDAIKITRGLGIKYLWVDALCIIQDLQEDVQREIAVMGDIYADSTLTIAAEDSESCTDGIFTERNWSSTAILPLDLRIPCREGQKGQMLSCGSVMLVPKFIESIKYERQTILATRGWTLQESVLSLRLLSYSKKDIRWRCFKGLWSESNLYIDDLRMPGENIFMTRDVDKGNKGGMFDTWKYIVKNYTSRQLTNATDTLTALAGLQGYTGRVLEDEPLLGLWRNTFFFPSLLWYCRSDQPVDERFRIKCPSWSWASACSPVEYHRILPPKDLIILPELGSLSLESIQNNVNIRGSIILTGCILPEDVLRDEKINNYTTWKDPHFPKDIKHVFLLHVADYCPARWKLGRQPVITVFMLIEKISQEKMHFRRVGLSEINPSRWKHTCVVKETIELF